MQKGIAHPVYVEQDWELLIERLDPLKRSISGVISGVLSAVLSVKHHPRHAATDQPGKSPRS